MAIDTRPPRDEPPDAPPARGFRIVGTRPVRQDGIDKVTGRARYGADLRLPGTSIGRILRSPHAHARLLSIDVSGALALPGVHAVVTGADLPDLAATSEQSGESSLDARDLSRNVLARDKVLYDGHAVAAVAATSDAVAEEALRRIDVRYEVLPPVVDLRAALAADAPILHPDLRTRGDPEAADRQTNVASVVQFERGELAPAFAASDVVLEREFDTAMVHQGYIEPHSALAQVNPDGQATLWCSTQGSFDVRSLTARVLGWPLSQLRVVPAEIGGGFGGKTTIYLEPVAVLLAQRSGRPVQMTMTRGEVLRATGPTSGSIIRVKIGARRDGRLTAVDAWLAYEAGAFAGSPVWAGAMTIVAPYDVPVLRIRGLDVVVNRPKTAAYRAPGATNAAFAAETVLDEIAVALDLDPIELRLRNAAREGTATPAGPRFKRVGFVECLEAVRGHEHWTAPLGSPGSSRWHAAPTSETPGEPPPAGARAAALRRGRGVAAGFWFNAGLQSSAVLSLNLDGTASLVTGSPDIGGTRTSCAMIAAEELGLPLEHVRASVADTDSIGHTDVTGGSRVTFATGWAVYEAAQDVQRQLVERAARTWKVTPGEVRFEPGACVLQDGTGSPRTRLSIAEITAQAGRTGGPIVGRATLNAQRGTGPAFAVCVVDVEVDVETGKVDVVRATIAQDAGRAIHPAYVEGQMQGGMAQGIGWGLNEEYVYDADGRLRNPAFLDYRIPVALDLPRIDTIVVEVPNPAHPYGVRGVGEVSIVPPPAAIASAIFRATGVRPARLPMSPPTILAALGAARAAGQEPTASGVTAPRTP